MVDEGYYKKNLKSSGYWNLGFKIHIDNNWSETKSTYDWCSGSGVWSDPYVIENVTINSGNSGSCILIESSRVYFRIKNCTVYNSGNGFALNYEGGIKMVNVTKGAIINNIAIGNQVGIFSYNCENNTILKNNANNNTLLGISLAQSISNFLSGNNANHNKYGIDLYFSDNNTFSGNNASNNTYSGIILLESNNNTLSGNTANNNKWRGIDL
ncbi:MAG: right-handed parallel beta-helix repeat-containing protein [Candidatus Lokiarchaeota archaeon]|nr:right-handed parallel beta-helix repeat-containing protein [Candidatus Lokiarchaeota archaeon]